MPNALNILFVSQVQHSANYETEPSKGYMNSYATTDRHEPKRREDNTFQESYKCALWWLKSQGPKHAPLAGARPIESGASSWTRTATSKVLEQEPRWRLPQIALLQAGALLFFTGEVHWASPEPSCSCASPGTLLIQNPMQRINLDSPSDYGLI